MNYKYLIIKLDFLQIIPQTDTLIESKESSCNTEQKGLNFLTKFKRIEQRNPLNDHNPRTNNTDSLLSLEENTGDEPTKSPEPAIQTSGEQHNVIDSNISNEEDILVQNHITSKEKQDKVF